MSLSIPYLSNANIGMPKLWLVGTKIELKIMVRENQNWNDNFYRELREYWMNFLFLEKTYLTVTLPTSPFLIPRSPDNSHTRDLFV